MARKRKWKHRNCLLVNKLVQNGPFMESFVWCTVHQERVKVRPK